MPDLRLFSTLGLAGALQELTPQFTQAKVEIILGPTALLMQRIRGGETADLAILVAESIDELIAAGTMRPGRTDLARSLVGIAVRAGAPRPDISTVEAFIATMHAAKSIAMSRAGASGLFFAGLLQRLGIAEEVNAKATVIPNGFTAELVADGRAELAVQQVSELMVVPGIDIVGTLPAGIESVITFSAGIFAGSQAAGAANDFLAMLLEPNAQKVFGANGLEPL